AAMTTLEPNVVRVLHANRRVAAEGLRRTDRAAADQLEELLVRGMHLHVIRDHQLYAIRLTGAEHPAALVRHDGHRPLADDVRAGARGLDGVVAVQCLRQRAIYGPYLAWLH